MSLETLDYNTLSCVYAKLDLDSTLAIRLTNKKHKAIVESSVSKRVHPETGLVEVIVNGNPVGIYRDPTKPTKFMLHGVGYVEEYDTDVLIDFKARGSVLVHNMAMKRYTDCKVNIMCITMEENNWYEDCVTEETITSKWETIYQSPEKTVCLTFDYYVMYQAYDGTWNNNPRKYEFWDFSPTYGIAIEGTIDRDNNDNVFRVYIKGELVCLQMTKPQFFGIYPLPGSKLDAEKVKEIRDEYATSPIDIEPFSHLYNAALIPE